MYADHGFASTVGSMKDKSDAVYQYVTNWGDANNSCGISGVAMKLSVATNITDAEIDGIRDNIKRYANSSSGPFYVHMTEVEVTCELQDYDGVLICKDKLDTARQAVIYTKLLQICLEELNCSAFELKGFTDRYSSVSGSSGLIFDKDYNKKSSYTSLLAVLNG